MERTFQIYKFSNIVLLLYFTYIFWTLDPDTMQFQILVGTAGVLLLLLLINFNKKKSWLTTIAYLAFFWGMETLFHNLSIIQYNTIQIWLLLMVGFIVILILSPPPTFLNGMLYGMWLFSIPGVVIQGLQFGWGTVVEWSTYLTILMSTVKELWYIILLFAYVITVLPFYISRQKAAGRFYMIFGFIAFIVSLPMTVLLGIVLGIYQAMITIISGFRKHVRRRKRALPRTTGQPAFEVYWFRKAFRDWRRVRVHVLKEYIASMKNLPSTGKGYTFTYGRALGIIPQTVAIARIYSALVLGFLLLMVVNSIHIVVISVIWVPVFLIFIVFASIDKFYLRKNKVKTVCPSCYHHSLLPNYVCSCGRFHTNLRPGLYGIRKRTCLCGKKLPTTHLDGRHELRAFCKNEDCKRELLTKEATPICISLVGGPSSGKTTYVISAIKELREKVAKNRGWETKFLQSEDEAYFSSQVDALNIGQFPFKTAEKRPFALNIWISNKKKRHPNLLYLYDPAGEVYRSSSELANHNYLRYVDGFCLVVDPFSFPEVASEFEDEYQRTNVNPSETLLQDTYDMLMVHLAKNVGIKEKKKISVPIAVVIQKVDAFKLDQQIVATKIEHENIKSDDYAMLNEKCKHFLKEVGYQTFVNRLESKFEHVQFFLSSAMSTNSAFQSSDAITWLLEKKGVK